MGRGVVCEEVTEWGVVMGEELSLSEEDESLGDESGSALGTLGAPTTATLIDFSVLGGRPRDLPLSLFLCVPLSPALPPSLPPSHPLSLSLSLSKKHAYGLFFVLEGLTVKGLALLGSVLRIHKQSLIV